MSADKLAQALQEFLSEPDRTPQQRPDRMKAAQAALAAHQAQQAQEPDCWAILTPNGSRLVSPDEAKGRKDAYPLYTSPQPAHVQGWQLVPEKITEEQHVAACKVLLRANGMDGLPQRMLDAIRAAAPQHGDKTAAESCIQGLRNVIAEDTRP